MHVYECAYTYTHARACVCVGVHEREKHSQASIHFAVQIFRLPLQYLLHKFIFIGLSDTLTRIKLENPETWIPHVIKHCAFVCACNF